MVRKKMAQPTPPPKLLVARVEAAQKIKERIQKGLDMKNIEIRDEDGLDSAEAEKTRWVRYNRELLTRIFDNDSVAEEYHRSCVAGVIPMGPSPLSRRVEIFLDTMRSGINCLESILERLELIPEVEEVRPTSTQASLPSLRRDVFVVHGHDEGPKHSVARFIEKLELNAIVLHEEPSRGRTIIEKFEDYSNVGFAVVLLTPDDVGAAKDQQQDLKPRARQNVIFELGYFLGKLGRKRVCALYKGDVEIASDYQGVLYVAMDDAGGWKMKLASEIKEAGIAVDLNKVV